MPSPCRRITHSPPRVRLPPLTHLPGDLVRVLVSMLGPCQCYYSFAHLKSPPFLPFSLFPFLPPLPSPPPSFLGLELASYHVAARSWFLTGCSRLDTGKGEATSRYDTKTETKQPDRFSPSAAVSFFLLPHTRSLL